MQKIISINALLWACIGVLSCQNNIPKPGFWTGAATLAEGRQLAIRMYLDLNARQGCFLVGEEKTPISEIALRGDSLILDFSEYGAAMAGVMRGNEWTGEYLRFREDTSSFQFVARPEFQASSKAESEPGVLPVGDFRVLFHDEHGIDSSNTATFWFEQDSLFGTLIDPSGDYGLLAGAATNGLITLHRFTGWQAILIELEPKAAEWHGRLYVRDLAPRAFTLKPMTDSTNTEAQPSLTTMRDPNAPFYFAGLAASGDSIRTTDARFHGKTLVVDIMGTWCHNCMDAAPVLQQLYSEFRDDGLEVVALAFEVSEDFDKAARNIQLFSKRHQIDYAVVFCGSTAKENVDSRLGSQLKNFFSYPTTLFIGRDGKVKRIHLGFRGPGTGSAYQKEVQMFREAVRGIMNRDS